MADNPIVLGLTYDDVLLIPKYSTVKSRKEVSTGTKFSRSIKLKIPIVASNMDTVCESETAIAMAREGGIGVLHRFCSVEEQCKMVRTVKRAQSMIIENPRCISPEASVEEAVAGMNWSGHVGGVGSLMVTDEKGVLLGIIVRKDLTFAPREALVRDIMTPFERLVYTRDPCVKLEQMSRMMFEKRISNIPVIDDKNVLVGLITSSDILMLTTNKFASLDAKGRLLVAAAVGVKESDVWRARELVKAGVDAIVVDIAHGHSGFCIDTLKKLKRDPLISSVDIIAGNIATAEAAKALIDAGADGLKVGVGPGSICITRIVAGSGVPQLTAIMEVYRVARKHGVPIIADGGIKTAGDISKAIAGGADTVMLGNMLAGTDESPGRVLVKDGKKVKIIRGMAGYGANISKSEREKNSDENIFLDMVPEGVEGNVPYKGPIAPILKQLVGGLRSGISYCGAKNLAEMREKATFIRMTPSGLKESNFHDISKI